ncbi:MAG: hypothetical protein COB53_11510 [Elusimicrobia bacterium]|nr:MAG: hypothetical protein COB53_11510 [Elusimicrobiota bacterium]
MLERCPGCASEVADDAEVCPGCGFKFVADTPPPQTHADLDNDPVLDGPASLDAINDPTLDGPASEADDLLAIQAGGILPRSMEGDNYEAPTHAAAPPKSQAAGFVIAGLCIAAMAASSFYFKNQKPAEASRAAAEAKKQNLAEEAKVKKEAKLAASQLAFELAKAAADKETAKKKKKGTKRRRRKSRSNQLEAPTQRVGLPEAPTIITSAGAVESNYGSLDIPTTDSGTPDFGSDFRVKGAVYDLYTMEPIGEVDIVFSDLKSGKKLSTVTDDSGVFRAHLPINGKGYSLRIRHTNYSPKYLEDGTPSLKDMSNDQRRSEGAELLRTMAKVTSFNAIRKRVIKRDFMLVPL